MSNHAATRHRSLNDVRHFIETIISRIGGPKPSHVYIQLPDDDPLLRPLYVGLLIGLKAVCLRTRTVLYTNLAFPERSSDYTHVVIAIPVERYCRRAILSVRVTDNEYLVEMGVRPEISSDTLNQFASDRGKLMASLAPNDTVGKAVYATISANVVNSFSGQLHSLPEELLTVYVRMKNPLQPETHLAVWLSYLSFFKGEMRKAILRKTDRAVMGEQLRTIFKGQVVVQHSTNEEIMRYAADALRLEMVSNWKCCQGVNMPKMPRTFMSDAISSLVLAWMGKQPYDGSCRPLSGIVIDLSDDDIVVSFQ